MEQLTDIKAEPLPLRGLLHKNNVRLWQVVRRLLSKGVFTTDSRLSRILNGIDQPPADIKKELEQIEKQLRKKDEKTNNKT